MLDLPVRNLMSDTVATVRRSAPLDEVVETMFDRMISSLVVTTDETEEPIGIITKTDVIEALTWERETSVPCRCSVSTCSKGSTTMTFRR